MEVIEGETLTKVCTKCGIQKELECFARKKDGKFGRDSRCKACMAEYARKWREENPEYNRKYYEENREVKLEYFRKYREENRDARLEYARKYHEENREAIREYKRKWHEENREARLEYFRKYCEENPHVHREKNRRRRARKLENGVVPYREVDIYERDNWTCQLCGKPIDPNAEYQNEDGSLNLWYKNIDHIIPLSKGGADAPHNVQASHFRCNVSKGDRIENDNDISRA